MGQIFAEKANAARGPVAFLIPLNGVSILDGDDQPFCDRDADRAMVGGVCAGIARHFGFNLCATRFLCVIALCVAFPFFAIAYLAVVMLVPAESRYDDYVVERVVRRRRRKPRRMSRRERRAAAEEERMQAEEEVRERARSLEERLARIERHVTSPRYRLDEEFSKSAYRYFAKGDMRILSVEPR